MSEAFGCYTYEDWLRYCEEKKLPRFRAKQLMEWIHKKYAVSFDEMTNLPKSLRDELKAEGSLSPMDCILKQESKLDGTRKYLFRIEGGEFIESVLMVHSYGTSACISTQAGCRMGCNFCASGLLGLTRNLTSYEMLREFYEMERDLGEPISHLVLMGTGEPLDNYDEVLRFLRILISPEGRNLGQRSITLSTCGLADEIRRFADEGLQVNLAISLHAPTDEMRLTMMPIARRYSIDEVLAAAKYYSEKTGRRVSYEYSLIEGKNDREEDAILLAERLRGSLSHVNLIPINPVVEKSYKEPKRPNVERFQKILEKHGITATIRRELGRDIDSACGQLRLHKRQSS